MQSLPLMGMGNGRIADDKSVFTTQIDSTTSEGWRTARKLDVNEDVQEVVLDETVDFDAECVALELHDSCSEADGGPWSDSGNVERVVDDGSVNEAMAESGSLDLQFEDCGVAADGPLFEDISLELDLDEAQANRNECGNCNSTLPFCDSQPLVEPWWSPLISTSWLVHGQVAPRQYTIHQGLQCMGGLGGLWFTGDNGDTVTLECTERILKGTVRGTDLMVARDDASCSELIWRRLDGSIVSTWRRCAQGVLAEKCLPTSGLIPAVVLTPRARIRSSPVQRAVGTVESNWKVGKKGSKRKRCPSVDYEQESNIPLKTVPIAWRVKVRIISAGYRFSPNLQEADLEFDCRLFSDPGAGALRGHDGHHPTIISRLVGHVDFPAFILNVVSAVQEKVAEYRCGGKGGQCVWIAFCCKSGRHRSVAATLIAQSLFRKMYASDVDVDHWHMRRCDCPECASRAAEAQRQTIFQEAWMQLLEAVDETCA